MRKISVCSWSLQRSAAKVAEEMEKGEIGLVQLALCPFVDPKAVVPGSAGDTEAVAGTGGGESAAKQRADVENFLASGRWRLSSAMFNSRYEDYSTLEAIRRTGGIAPDEHWEENRRLFGEAAKLAAAWKAPSLMLHAGYIDHLDRAAYAKMRDRVRVLRDICADQGLDLTLETGQETADQLGEFLVTLEGGVFVNFDPANMILYGKGDPIAAVAKLGAWIRHVHVKDAVSSAQPGVAWGAEAEWTKGEVGAGAFIAALDAIGYAGALAVEREAGNDRAGDIARAWADLKSR